MFENLVFLILAISVTYGKTITGNFSCEYDCIPLSECAAVKRMVDNDTTLDDARSLLCGYLHEPLVCCKRDCVTPNGSDGYQVLLTDCPNLKANQGSTDTRKLQFLNYSSINETHVCCNEGEDTFRLVQLPQTSRPKTPLSTECITPNGELAECRDIGECEAYKDVASKTDAEFHFINDSICGYWERPMICCGYESAYNEDYGNKLPSASNCGTWDNVTNPNIPPWMAVITTQSSSVCVGALINPEYVLATIACTGQKYKKLNIKFRDCINDEKATACRFQVNDLKTFPLYTYLFSEDVGIVLLKLNKPAISGLVPVCLSSVPLSISQPINLIKLERSESRWTGNNLLTNTIYNSDCDLPIHLRIICMKSTDICQSSKDLLLQHFILRNQGNRWYLEGLFNKPNCHGPSHNYFHAIYIYKFLPWIKSNIS